MRHWPWTSIAASIFALTVLLAVFGLYLQPEFMMTLANQVWACF